MVQFVFQSEKLQHFAATLRIFATVTVNAFREPQISLGCERGKEIESLKHETNLAAANVGSLGVTSSSQILVIHDDAAGGRS